LSHSIDHEYPLDVSPLALADRLKSPAFALARLNAARREDIELVSHVVTEGVVRIVTRYFVPLGDLPSWMAMRFKEHGPQNKRVEEWKLVDGVGRATFTQTSPDGGGTVTGHYEIVEADGGCVWKVHATADYPAPLIGGRVEKFMLASLDRASGEEAAVMSAAWS